MRRFCVKCGVRARKTVLPTYEYAEGVPLRNVEVMECPKCREFMFTEKQLETVEKRTEALKAHRFAFRRRLTISGRSFVINIPEDLVRHMHLFKGKTAKLTPLDDKRFLVEF